MIRFLPQFFGITSKSGVNMRTGRISNDALDNDYHLIGVIFGAVIFGSIHVAGWRLSFPTDVEKVFWRVASIFLTALLPVMFIPACLRLYLKVKCISWRFIKVWDICFGSLYLAARLFMLVEIFRSLDFLPSSAYFSTWATNIPHVG